MVDKCQSIWYHNTRPCKKGMDQQKDLIQKNKKVVDKTANL
jgi:hypothetical protein